MIIGNRLLLADGSIATVAGNDVEVAPVGEHFTTYNFEVEEFHTYFAGEGGVWVHNKGPACERAFGWYKRIIEKIRKGEIPSTNMDPNDIKKSPSFAAITHVENSIKGLESEGVASLYADGFDDLIRNGEKNWLDFWEGRQTVRGAHSTGHTLSKHVGKTDAEIIAGAGNLSSYTNRALAEEAIASYFTSNRQAIIDWAKVARSGQSNTQVLPGVPTLNAVVDMQKDLGKGFSAANGLELRQKAKIIIVADGRGGWHILSSYPVQ